MNTWLLRAIGLCVCAGVLIAAGRSAATAHDRVHAARATHAETVSVAQRLAAARLAENTAANPSGGSRDAMVAWVSSSLTRAGIPVARMTSLSPGGSASTGPSVRLSDGATVRQVRRSASMSLDQVSLPELGGFLQAWRAQQPSWRVSSLQATPIPLRAGDLPAGKALPGNVLARPLSVHVTLETTSIEREANP